jgi:hypothetical protein
MSAKSFLGDYGLRIVTEQAVTGTTVTATGVNLDSIGNSFPAYGVCRITTAFVDGTGTANCDIDFQASPVADTTGYASAGSLLNADMNSYAVGDIISVPLTGIVGPYWRVVLTPGSAGAYSAGKLNASISPVVGYTDNE